MQGQLPPLAAYYGIKEVASASALIKVIRETHSTFVLFRSVYEKDFFGVLSTHFLNE